MRRPLLVPVLAESSVLDDVVEVGLRGELVVPFLGEVFVVLELQLRVCLVGVEGLAVGDELVVVAAEGGEVDPLTFKAAAVVLAVCAAVDGGVLVAVIRAVVIVGVHELFGGVIDLSLWLRQRTRGRPDVASSRL